MLFKFKFDMFKGLHIHSYNTRFSCNLRPTKRRFKKCKNLPSHLGIKILQNLSQCVTFLNKSIIFKEKLRNHLSLIPCYT